MKTSFETVLELDAPQAAPESAHSPSRRNLRCGEEPLPQAPSVASLPSVIVGTLVGFDPSGAPLVEFPGHESEAALPARSLIAVAEPDAGCEVALVFENGDPTKPVILGRLQVPHAGTPANPINASVDGEEVTLSAKNEIVLRCGKSSITLTRAGKIIIRGAYLLSRSSGVNRIKGGSVQIN